MRITIQSDEASITPGGYKSFSVEFQCNESDLVNQIPAEDIAKNYNRLDDLIDAIGIDSCTYHFGSELLEKFTIDEVLEQYPIEEIIKHIGQDKFRDYIREIFIDKVIDEEV